MKMPPSLFSAAQSLVSGLPLVLEDIEGKISTLYGMKVTCVTRATARDRDRPQGAREGGKGTG